MVRATVDYALEREVGCITRMRMNRKRGITAPDNGSTMPV